MARPTRWEGAARALWACAFATCVASAEADAPEPQPVAPAAIESAGDYGLSGAIDPLERARAVARLGDARVLSVLAPRRGERGAIADAERVLAALHCVPWLADPSAAFPVLLELMQGRDPDLAPAAARALVDAARSWVEAQRVPETVSVESLAAWAGQLAPIEQNLRVRPDIRLAATEASALLNAARERL